MDARERARLWYEVVEDTQLWQGDIIRNLLAYAFPQDLPVINREPTPDETFDVKAGWDFGDWIVMSASCDLERSVDKYPFVLVCRVWPASQERLGIRRQTKFDQGREVIRKGYDPLRFMLAEHPDEPHLDLSFAQYRPHLTLPRDYLRSACIGRRLRLKPPYREWFGSWVGANFSRVGIDDDAQIPKFIDDGEPSAEARITVSEIDVAAPASSAVQQPIKSTAGGVAWPAWSHGLWRALKKLRGRT